MRRIAVSLLLPLFLWTVAAAAASAAEPPPTTSTDTVRGAAEQAEAERRRQGAQAPGGKDWTFGLFAGVQYEDNVILRNEHVLVGGDRTDWKSVNALFADYRLVNTDARVLGLRYNAYQTFLDKHDELQLTGNGVTLHHTEIHAPFVLDVPVSFAHYDLQDDKYLNLGTVSPALYFEETSRLVGVVRGSFQHFDYYKVPGSGFDEPDRSSKVYEGGLEQWLLLGERAQWRVEAGWAWRHEDARENEWSNDAWAARLGLRGALPWWKLGLETGATFTDKDYQERNDLFGKTQHDEIVTLGLGLSRPISDWATVTVAYLFTRDDSNVESQDYRRNQATLGVTFLF